MFWLIQGGFIYFTVKPSRAAERDGGGDDDDSAAAADRVAVVADDAAGARDAARRLAIPVSEAPRETFALSHAAALRALRALVVGEDGDAAGGGAAAGDDGDAPGGDAGDDGDAAGGFGAAGNDARRLEEQLARLQAELDTAHDRDAQAR